MIVVVKPPSPPVEPLAAAAAGLAFYEFFPHVCLVLDPEGRILSINARGVRRLGYDRDELVGAHVDRLLPPEGRALAAGQRAEALARPGQLVCCELDHVGRDGVLARVREEIVAPPVAGSGRVLLVVWMDVTGERAAQEALAAERARAEALTLEATLAEERERRRLGVLLHDEIGQRLAVAKITLLRQQGIGGGGHRAAEELVRLIDESIAVARTLTADLSAPVLYELGLEAALKDLCQRTSKEQGLRASLVVEGPPRELAERTAVVLFRTARELVHNVVKHACANGVVLRLEYAPGFVALAADDDGRGFAEGAQGRGAAGGVGLFSVRQQVASLGGSCVIESRANAGAHVEVRVPW